MPSKNIQKKRWFSYTNCFLNDDGSPCKLANHSSKRQCVFSSTFLFVIDFRVENYMMFRRTRRWSWAVATIWKMRFPLSLWIRLPCFLGIPPFLPVTGSETGFVAPCRQRDQQSESWQRRSKALEYGTDGGFHCKPFSCSLLNNCKELIWTIGYWHPVVVLKIASRI